MISELAPKIESLLQNPEVVAPAVVILGIFIRVYFGKILFHPRYVRLWSIARKIGVPILNRVALNRVGVDIENKAYTEEYVAVTDLTPRKIGLKLCKEFPTEVPLLAGHKTDWEDREEIGTLTVYHGPKPFPSAPDWLRDRQTHMTFFRYKSGETIVTAHDEANSYRPDQWADHLYKKTQSADQGTENTVEYFNQADIDYEQKDIF